MGPSGAREPCAPACDAQALRRRDGGGPWPPARVGVARCRQLLRQPAADPRHRAGALHGLRPQRSPAEPA
eukprot:3376283-Lingulodinium_polyedra.AAC.1